MQNFSYKEFRFFFFFFFFFDGLVLLSFAWLFSSKSLKKVLLWSWIVL